MCRGHPPGTSAHIIADCAIPTYFIQIFNIFSSLFEDTKKFKLDTVNFEFGFPQPEFLNSTLNEQFQHIFFSIKMLSLDAHRETRFSLWGKVVYYAKILTRVKNVLLVRRFAHLPWERVDKLVDFLLEQQDMLLLLR